MIDWLTDPFALAFQQRALLGGALAAVATSAVGIWVVVRGMTFLGDALVHGVVPGIAVATLIGIDPAIGAAVAAVVMIGGIRLVHRQTAFSEDTGIGLLFVGMLGLGVILISRTTSYTGSLTAILFGNALGVTRGDLLWLGAVAVVTVAASLLFYRRFLVLSFNEQKAQAPRPPPRPVARSSAGDDHAGDHRFVSHGGNAPRARTPRRPTRHCRTPGAQGPRDDGSGDPHRSGVRRRRTRDLLSRRDFGLRHHGRISGRAVLRRAHRKNTHRRPPEPLMLRLRQ